MDPLSGTASTIAIVGLLSQSCRFLFTIFRDISDAPTELEYYTTALRALEVGLGRIQALHTVNASTFQLTPEFSSHAAQCMADFRSIEARLTQAKLKFDKGRGVRMWAMMKWSLSAEHWLGKFLARVQIFHTIVSLELRALETYALTLTSPLASFG